MEQLIGGYNRGQLLFVGDWGTGWIAAALALAIVVLLITWLDTAELTRRRRVILTTLRALTLGAAILLLLEPTLELRHVNKLKNEVAILVDTSASGALPGLGGKPRATVASEALRSSQTFLDAPNDDHAFRLFSFSSAASAVPIAELVGASGPLAKPTGAATHLLEAMDAAAKQIGPSKLGGFVVISDGIDNGLLAGRVKRGEPLDELTRTTLTTWGVPVHTAATARAGELKDIAVERVLKDDFAFIRNKVTVEAEVKAVGYSEGTLAVSLRRNGKLEQTRTVELVPDKTSYRVTFEFVPELIGEEVLSISVPPLTGEALTSNNELYFLLHLIRDKIRALHVTGSPSWDSRFMRQLLRGNANVELVSFFILRTQEDITQAPQSELSLIPFPTEELFNEQLGSFDLILFHNFDYGPYGMSPYLERIHDYVMAGGAMVMIGGDRSFSQGGYLGTPIEEILPVKLSADESRTTGLDLAPFIPQLTPAGLLHPITRVELDPVRNRKQWEELTPVLGTNLVGDARDGATVLATHPTLKTSSGHAMPVIAVTNMGKGRTMAVTTDESWKWSFEDTLAGHGGRGHSGFWNSSIRWLMRDPELNLVQLDLPRSESQPGETTTLTVRLFENDYQPAVDRQGELTVYYTPFADLERPAEKPASTLPFKTDAQGRFVHDFAAGEAGLYRLVASTKGDGAELLTDTKLLLALPSQLEWADLEPRPDLLQALAEAGGGTFLEADDLSFSKLSFAEPKMEQVNRRRVIALWNQSWVLALLGLLFGAEWILRRRWGRL